MTLAPSLLQQRLKLQGQLKAQRQDLALQLFEAKARSGFPRSITMRVLIHRPEFVGRLIALVAGDAAGRVVSALLVGVQLLNPLSGVAARPLPDAPRPNAP